MSVATGRGEAADQSVEEPPDFSDLIKRVVGVREQILTCGNHDLGFELGKRASGDLQEV